MEATKEQIAQSMDLAQTLADCKVRFVPIPVREDSEKDFLALLNIMNKAVDEVMGIEAPLAKAVKEARGGQAPTIMRGFA